MRCEDCLPFLEEYLDGEMSQRDADRVAAHLAACARCGAAFDSIRTEQEIYSRYSRDVEITPALWTAVQRRIGSDRAVRSFGLLSALRNRIGSMLVTPRLSPLAVMLLVAVAIAATIWLTTMLNSEVTSPPIASPGPGANEPQTLRPQDPSSPDSPEDSISDPQPERVIATAPPKSPHRARTQKRGAPTADQLVREAEQKYLAAIAILNRDVERQRKTMDPRVVARLDEAIMGIDRTIAETRRALRENPGDTLALEYMLTAYARKVDLLRDIASY